RFGLCLHIGVDPVPGVILWLNVYWTNSNPRLILKYYLDTVEELGYMPLVSQSDPGTENFGLANGHTLLCQYNDPSLAGTLQHRWMNRKKNVQPEMAWSGLRRRWSEGFENELEVGVREQWYNPDNLLQGLVFRWVFIPWIQAELNSYKHRVNNTAKRADRKKILPHGVPSHIAASPQDYGVLDFKIPVEKETIEQVRTLYAPRDHAVFELVPPDFAVLAQEFYFKRGEPAVGHGTAWNVYLALLD
ncbi:hypothetical protein C8F01DRAFT_1346312, partial [Mycena amicta]